MSQPLHIIHVEDSQQDFELVEQMLQSDGFALDMQRIETRDQFERALLQSRCDLILSDCTLPQFHGLEALKLARAAKPEVPFIFVSGTIGEETAIESLRNGATDYVLKQRLSRLVPAVRRALAEVEGRRARRAMASQLRQARKLESIGTLVGGLAHDFRNLLQVIKMNISVLSLKAYDPLQVIKIAQQMDKAADRGCGMMHELLVFARKTDSNFSLIDLAGQIRETCQMLLATLPDRISLSLDLERDLPFILADPGQLDRIITNLVGNARDAMPAGGAVTVFLDAVRLDHLPENSWQIRNAPYLRVRVTDNGTGMNEETQARIFEPFFTTKPAGKGTGLGLPVVFGLMDAHQGFIDVDSAPGEGTTFSLFFPLPPGASLDPDRTRVISPTRLLGKTSEEDSPSI